MKDERGKSISIENGCTEMVSKYCKLAPDLLILHNQSNHLH